MDCSQAPLSMKFSKQEYHNGFPFPPPADLPNQGIKPSICLVDLKALSALNLAAGHHQPRPLLETPRHSQASLGQSLVGSLLLSPGSWCTQVSVRALQESVSSVLCKFWGSMLGLMATSSSGAYVIPRSTAARAPGPVAGHC